MATNNTGQIRRLLKVLGYDFAQSQNPNSRKGGLIGLAAIAIALGKVRCRRPSLLPWSIDLLLSIASLDHIWKPYMEGGRVKPKTLKLILVAS